MIQWLLVAVLVTHQFTSEAQGFKVVREDKANRVSVLYNGRLLTAYCFYDSIRKPILFPVNTLDGITVTRGYPIAPLPGERTDHPHHTGIWMNYESVNGLDFWNNSTAIPIEKRNHYGTIRHKKILAIESSQERASISATAEWIRPDSVVLLEEKTSFVFTIKNKTLLIDRSSTLTAVAEKVIFKDVKDGFLGIRVARELETPSKEASKYIDIHGNQTEVPMDNKGVTGKYVNSDGINGDSVWGTSSRWAMLSGKKQGRDVSVAIIDHPGNTGFPTYWHARGYGLFASNPLGRNVFSNGKEQLNLTLEPGRSVTFKYRILIHSGETMTPDVVNRLADQFGKEN